MPAYNEAVSLPSLLRKIEGLKQKDSDLQVVVVDDGSEDDTARICEEYQGIAGLTLLRHPENRGLGRAINTGLRWAVTRAHADTVIVTMDADDTHDPALVPQMAAKIRQGYDVVIASRYQAGGEQVGLSRVRKILSWGASALLGRLFRLEGVKDYSSGFRAYRAGILQKAFDHYEENFIEARGFDCMAEILLKLRSFNVRFAEVALVLRYDRKTGASKMPVFETVCNYLFLARRVARLDDRS